jgi:transcriptional regulator with XRE-family HTH domain
LIDEDAMRNKINMKVTVSAGALPKVAEYLNVQLDLSPKTQREIALEIGYERPNIITMFKQGLTKVPITKIAPLARALGVDPAYFLRIAMNEYMPDTLEAIEQVFGAIVTANEAEIIEVIREATQGKNPRIATSAQREIIANAAQKLGV